MKQKRSQTKTAALHENSPPYHINGNGAHNKLRFIDLFCGIGGFRLAFEKAGCECVFSSDWNKYAQQTYAANFGETPVGDIHSVAVAHIPAHDVLCAGFPCQPFSIAGVSKKLSLGKVLMTAPSARNLYRKPILKKPTPSGVTYSANHSSSVLNMYFGSYSTPNFSNSTTYSSRNDFFA